MLPRTKLLGHFDLRKMKFDESFEIVQSKKGYGKEYAKSINQANQKRKKQESKKANKKTK